MYRFSVFLFALACNTGGVPNGVSATCTTACQEYTSDAEELDVCSAELDTCYQACEEITANTSGACLACLADNAIVGPDPYRDRLPEDTGRATGELMCELGYIAAGDDCAASCP